MTPANHTIDGINIMSSASPVYSTIHRLQNGIPGWEMLLHFLISSPFCEEKHFPMSTNCELVLKLKRKVNILTKRKWLDMMKSAFIFSWSSVESLDSDTSKGSHSCWCKFTNASHRFHPFTLSPEPWKHYSTIYLFNSLLKATVESTFPSLSTAHFIFKL